jgi:hypothetical protein
MLGRLAAMMSGQYRLWTDWAETSARTSPPGRSGHTISERFAAMRTYAIPKETSVATRGTRTVRSEVGSSGK